MAHTIRTSHKRPFEDFASDNGQPTFEKEPTSDSSVTPSGDGNMCSRCRAIDFDEIFTRKYKYDWSFVMNLGSVIDLAASHCHICKMFLSVTSPSLQASGKQCHLRIFSAINSLTGFFSTSYGQPRYEDNNLLGVVPETSNSRSSGYLDAYTTSDHLDVTGYLSLDLPVEPLNVCRVRTLQSQRCDLGLVNTWMDYCDKNHSTRCSRKTFAQLRRFRIIDCRTRRVVDATMGCQYVALSYVWGDPPVSGSSSTSAPKSATKRKFDKVVEDALVVTQVLGFFYLWVDKICINQVDDIDKSQRMRQMDLIYANATLTIIAAAGAGPNYGLPGINKTPRVQQQKFQCKGRTIIKTLPSGKHTLQASKWYTRGWTYQESALSKDDSFSLRPRCFLNATE